MLKLIILIWINNMIIVGWKLATINHFKANCSTYFKVIDLGELRYVLGILIEHDYTNCIIYLSVICQVYLFWRPSFIAVISSSNPSKSLSSIMTILLVTYLCSNDIIILNP